MSFWLRKKRRVQQATQERMGTFDLDIGKSSILEELLDEGRVTLGARIPD